MQASRREQLEVPVSPLWYKVTGMLAQNWAMVAAHPANDRGTSQVRIYFFNDHGRVFDTLDYSDTAHAERAMEFNDFTRLENNPEFEEIAGLPSFPLTRSALDARPVYSSGEYWQQPPEMEQTTACHPSNPDRLQRFVDAQAAPVMKVVLEELDAGRKTSHWMWFVFPQLQGLGHSPMARKFGIQDLQEARAYLAHPVLGPRLHECFELVLEHQGCSAEEIFGEIDAKKFRSCATLFAQAEGTQDSVFALALDAFFKSEPDPLTLGLL